MQTSSPVRQCRIWRRWWRRTRRGWRRGWSLHRCRSGRRWLSRSRGLERDLQGSLRGSTMSEFLGNGSRAQPPYQRWQPKQRQWQLRQWSWGIRPCSLLKVERLVFVWKVFLKLELLYRLWDIGLVKLKWFCSVLYTRSDAFYVLFQLSKKILQEKR